MKKEFIKRKSLFNTFGRVIAKFELSRGGIRQIVIGQSKISPSVSSDIVLLLENSLLDAKYRFLFDNDFINNIENEYFEKKVSNLKKVVFVLLDYHIEYLKGDFTIKRENWKGKYFNVVRDNKGRFLSRIKFTSMVYDDVETSLEDEFINVEKEGFKQRFL